MTASTILPAEQPRRAGRLALASALAAACTWNLTSIGGSPDELAAALGTGLGTIGLLGGVLWLVHGVVQLPVGWAIDRIGARRLSLLALAGLVVANGVAAIAPDVWLIGATRMLVGLCCGGGTICAVVYARGPTAVGQGIVGAVTAGAGGAPLLFVPLAMPALGWRAPFVLGAVLAVAVLALFAVRGPADPPASATVAVPPPRSLRSLLANGPLLRLAALLGAFTMLSWTMGNWIVPLLSRDGRFSSVLCGVLGAIIIAGGIVSRPVGAWIPVRTRVSGSRLMVGCLTVGTLAVATVASGAPVGLTVLAIVALGLTAGMPWAVILHAAGGIKPAESATAVGVVGTLGTMAAVVSIPLFGVAFDTGHERLALGALATVTLLCLLAIPRSTDLEGRPRRASTVRGPEGAGVAVGSPVRLVGDRSRQERPASGESDKAAAGRAGRRDEP